MNTTSGIVHNAGLADGVLVSLPLEELRSQVVIIDVCARVTLTQIFTNPSPHATSEAVYHLPVPASAAICSFDMRLSNGKVIQGISKDNKTAVEEYERAVREGRDASLLKWVTDDIFTISIGSILAHETVETHVVFVMDLMNDDTNQIRFHLPMHVGERYGEVPPDLVGTSAPSSRTRVRLTIDVQTSGRILNIECPSHPGQITESRYPTHLDRPSRRRATVKYRSKSFLSHDFILIVEAEKLDSPRCFAELEGDPDRKASLALQLMVVPKFEISPRTQEYIFVVDRSGSMEGPRIETAKRTLAMLLRMLPDTQSCFNIISFGNYSDGLWDRSEAYNQHTLDIATSLVDRMEANLGGTEIANALHRALNTRRSDIATAIFVLTDGESHDIDRAVSLVQDASRAASPSAPIHVHVLGIGERVSTAMCESIATAGNGVCLYAHQAESITLKCTRLLQAGRTPFIRNVTIDWGLSEEYLSSSSSSVSFSITPSSQRITRLQSFPVLQQAPAKIHDLHAGVRFSVYAILRLKRVSVPQEVVLRGEIDDTGVPFEWRVPIRGVLLTNSEPGLPTIHTMAAWRLIQEHDIGRAPTPVHLPVTGDQPSNAELHEAAIIRLGETYQLASRHTSFVAVDSATRDGVRDRGRSTDFGNWGHGSSRSQRSPSNARHSATSRNTDLVSSLGALGAGLLSGLESFFIPLSTTATMPGQWPESPSRSPSRSVRSDYPDDEGYESSGTTATFTTLSSLEGSESDWSDWTEPASPVSERIQQSPPPQFVPIRFAPPDMRPQLVPSPPRVYSPPPPPPLLPEVVDLVRMQQYDGSYPLDDSLRPLVGNIAFEAMLSGGDERAWATALAVAFIMKKMGNQRELLDEFLHKAIAFLKSGGNEDLIERARLLLTTA